MKQHVKLYEEYSEFEEYIKSMGGHFLETKEDVKEWLDYFKIKKYTINDDLTVDVDGDVNISSEDILIIRVQFRKVSGTFCCDRNKLVSLKGSPTFVGESFYCEHNRLTSLEGAPEHIGKIFHCDINELTTLKGCPKHFQAIYCENNKLTSLEYIPTKPGIVIYCDRNELTSLVFAPNKPTFYDRNPCSDIYQKLGFTTEAHAKSLLELDPNLKQTIEKLQVQFPERYDELMTNRELRFALGMEDEELTNTYNKVKSIEGGYF